MINPGLLRIDKPEGITSAHLLDQFKADLKARLNVKKSELPKIGHAGTLDPFATGLLLVFLGDAVRLSEYFLKGDKVYEGTIQLGIQTDTGDLTGSVVHRADVPNLLLSEIERATKSFVNDPYFQTPPMYSAIKKDGKALYEYARSGISIEREAVLRRIMNFEIKSYDKDEIRFLVKVSSGTYIRVLAEDFAKKLGTVGVLKSLRRLESSQWTLEQVRTWDQCRMSINREDFDLNSWREFVPFSRVLERNDSLAVSDEERRMIFTGDLRVLARSSFLDLLEEMKKKGTSWSPVYFETQLIAVVHRENQVLKFGKVFPN